MKDDTGFVPSNYVKKIKPSILDSLKNIGKGTLGRKRSADRIQVRNQCPVPVSCAVRVEWSITAVLEHGTRPDSSDCAQDCLSRWTVVGANNAVLSSDVFSLLHCV